jgi:hypothetical protein
MAKTDFHAAAKPEYDDSCLAQIRGGNIIIHAASTKPRMRSLLHQKLSLLAAKWTLICARGVNRQSVARRRFRNHQAAAIRQALAPVSDRCHCIGWKSWLGIWELSCATINIYLYEAVGSSILY